MLLNCGFGEYSWESLGLQGDPPTPCQICVVWAAQTSAFKGVQKDLQSQQPSKEDLQTLSNQESAQDQL